MKFRKKPAVIEAITFDELVAHGRANSANIVNGMPWSFVYGDAAVSHENDQQYLVMQPNHPMVKVFPSTMLVTGETGQMYAMDRELFEVLFETAPDSQASLEAAFVGLGFGQALDAVKAGRRAARAGWNGTGMFISVREGSADISDEKAAVNAVPRALFAKGNTGTVTRMPCLDLRLPSGAHQPGWVPSQTDLLAEDWFLLE